MTSLIVSAKSSISRIWQSFLQVYPHCSYLHFRICWFSKPLRLLHSLAWTSVLRFYSTRWLFEFRLFEFKNRRIEQQEII